MDIVLLLSVFFHLRQILDTLFCLGFQLSCLSLFRLRDLLELSLVSHYLPYLSVNVAFF